MIKDPFASLVEEASGSSEQAALFPASSGTDLPGNAGPKQAECNVDKRKGKSKKSAPRLSKEEKVLLAAKYLYSPDATVAAMLGRPMAEGEWVEGKYPPKRKPVLSNLPKVVISSKFLHAAREFCEHFADVRATITDEGKKDTAPTNAWLEGADRMLRVHGYSYSELCAVVAYAHTKGYLVSWITTTYGLERFVDTIVSEGGFGLWITQNGIPFAKENFEAARHRLFMAEQRNARMGYSSSKDAANVSPTGVRTGDHAQGGRRVETF